MPQHATAFTLLCCKSFHPVDFSSCFWWVDDFNCDRHCIGWSPPSDVFIKSLVEEEIVLLFRSDFQPEMLNQNCATSFQYHICQPQRCLLNSNWNSTCSNSTHFCLQTVLLNSTQTVWRSNKKDIHCLSPKKKQRLRILHVFRKVHLQLGLPDHHRTFPTNR